MCRQPFEKWRNWWSPNSSNNIIPYEYRQYISAGQGKYLADLSTANSILYSNILVNLHITYRMSRVTDTVNVRKKPQPETMSSHRMGDYDSYMVDAWALIVNLQ